MSAKIRNGKFQFALQKPEAFNVESVLNLNLVH